VTLVLMLLTLLQVLLLIVLTLTLLGIHSATKWLFITKRYVQPYSLGSCYESLK